jgi:hypothetical protein
LFGPTNVPAGQGATLKSTEADRLVTYKVANDANINLSCDETNTQGRKTRPTFQHGFDKHHVQTGKQKRSSKPERAVGQMKKRHGGDRSTHAAVVLEHRRRRSAKQQSNAKEQPAC